MNKIIILSSICIAIILNGCSKKQSQETIIEITPLHTPTTYNELIASEKITNRITLDGTKIINDSFNQLITNKILIDPQKIADQIKKVENVKNAFPNQTGSSIIVQQTDGKNIILIIKTQDDIRLDPVIKINNSPAVNPIQTFSEVSRGRNYPAIIPTIKKAVILAPFEASFKSDLYAIATILANAGYSVDIFPDNLATLDKFRGDFLKKYGVIYIKTHGTAQDNFLGVFPSTTIATGEIYDEKKLSEIELGERLLVRESVNLINNVHYFGVSPEYIKYTLTDKFPNSLVFIDACESAINNDLSGMFLKNGAIGYQGYNQVMRVYFTNMISLELMSLLEEGTPLSNTKPSLTYDPGVKKVSLPNVPGANINALINVFDQNNSQILINRDNSGTAVISPSFGYIGNPVMFYGFANVYNSSGINLASTLSVTTVSTGQTMLFGKSTGTGNQLAYWEYNTVLGGKFSSIPYVDLYIFKTFDIHGNILETLTSTGIVLNR